LEFVLILFTISILMIGYSVIMITEDLYDNVNNDVRVRVNENFVNKFWLVYRCVVDNGTKVNDDMYLWGKDNMIYLSSLTSSLIKAKVYIEHNKWLRRWYLNIESNISVWNVDDIVKIIDKIANEMLIE